MLKVVPGELPQPKLHEYLLSCVAPRPIAFVSTVDRQGKVNLAPFSFFNVFGSNPPVLIFSPALSGRTGKAKNTLENLRENGECVVNIVSYDIIHQCNLASAEFDKGVDEFIKAGLNKLPAEKVKPPRLAESKAQMECKVLQIIETGTGGGAGNLVVCEVLLLHISEKVLDESGSVSPYLFDQVARMGKNFWARMIPEAIISMPPMPDANQIIGFDQLPENVKLSPLLTANEKALLARSPKFPHYDDIVPYVDLANHSKEQIVEACRNKLLEGNYFDALCIASLLPS
ncbi:MAG: flavin reductase family protein [Chitinophagales bacterium]|nr:flavin reductase family protein [Chitinophagales bacterium]MDW8273363.1 flavin reductase family protein [Chitinophagales bacterium]